MKVLVLGGAGYVGSAVVREMLNHGHEVTCFDMMMFGAESMMPWLGRPDFKLVKGDIRNAEEVDAATAGHNAVILLASIVGEPACNRDPDNTRATNVGGAENALAAAKKHGVKHFIFASTCSNYGVADTDVPVAEDGRLNPISVYSETKVETEQLTLAAASDTLIPTVLRLSTAFGVSARMRFDLLVSDFTLAGHKDGKVVIFGEQFWRPFVHINDIAKCMRMVLAAPREAVDGEVFNVGANHNNTQKQTLGESVAKHLPGTEIEFVTKNEDPRSYRVEFAKVKDKIGFEPDWDIDAGIIEVRDCLQNGVWPDPTDGRYKN
ncbi:NAD-dependent epimerase/dehydratase family protein [Algisphaera agarilytica]|uniref:Nucleoside-diphosphate-sugar epimerase n=1 Tax=Algisphaera agarilytica TaxID=1385975 RepID=A0A7X0LKL4_9BACT|nr:NAD(P)-dependent oxidoreductase [Algisphaera agarilytica]MBB6430560.1 nucleoside-diphosphate-sugar epimerase [Algisphaera agarilytica]